MSALAARIWENSMKSKKLGSIARSAALTVAAAGLLFEVGGSAMAANYAYMSCGQLWYARNAIYAQEGFCFKTTAGQNAFPNSCFPPYGKLTKWEAKEVAKIKYWENRKGCT